MTYAIGNVGRRKRKGTNPPTTYFVRAHLWLVIGSARLESKDIWC
jgi:hypothetical protein